MMKIIAAGALLATMAAQPAAAAVVPTTSTGSHDDAFEGATVLQVSPLESAKLDANFENNDQLGAARDLFGATLSIPEPGNVLFAGAFADEPVSPFVVFDIGSAVAISTIKTYLADDSSYGFGEFQYPAYSSSRGLSRITFSAGDSISTLSEIGSLDISANYFNSYGRSVIEATINIANPTAYRYYSFSALNVDGRTGGARVLEIDGFTAAVPEPATWAMMLVGFGMVAGVARYRRRSTVTAYA